MSGMALFQQNAKQKLQAAGGAGRVLLGKHYDAVVANPPYMGGKRDERGAQSIRRSRTSQTRNTIYYMGRLLADLAYRKCAFGNVG